MDKGKKSKNTVTMLYFKNQITENTINDVVVRMCNVTKKSHHTSIFITEIFTKEQSDTSEEIK